MSRIAAWRSAFAVAVLSLLVADTQSAAQLSELEQEAMARPKPELAEDAPPEVVRIHELTEQVQHQLALVLALDQDEAASTGDDAEALHRIATEVRIDLVDPIREMSRLVVKLEEQGVDTSYFRERLHDVLPRFGAGLKSLFESEQERSRALADAASTATGSDRAAIERRVQRQDALVGRILAAGLVHVGTLEDLALPTDESEAWLSENLARQARLMSGRIEMAKVQLDDVSARADSAPDDAALAAELSTARRRHEVAVEALGTIVSRMRKLDMDTAQYQQILIESTGEITTDIFSQGVAKQLFQRWLGGVGDSIAENGPAFFFKSFLFALVLGFFWALSRFMRRLIQRALAIRDLGFSQLLKRMIVSTASSAVLLMGLLIALSQLGFEVGPMLAGLGIAGFVLGFALQDTLSNFASGIMILAYRPYDVGDLIDCAGGVFGKVSVMNLVSTTILTVDNQTRVVPNGKIWGDVITNVTAQRERRVDLVVGISYDDDIPHAEEVVRSILEEHPKVLSEPEAVVKVHELGDSSVNLIVRPWVLRDDYWDVYWDVTREIKLRFDREGISIPFPQQDMHFKFPPSMPAPVGHDAMEIGSSSPTSQSHPDADT